jgi:transketolase
VDRILAEFRTDERPFLLKLDCGFSILDVIEKEFPDRVLNVGCREQCCVSMAAGMAYEGLRPIIYSIASFLIFRALEQIRLNLVEDGHVVKLVGYGAGDERFKELGVSHTTGEADVDICDAIGLPVFSPFMVNEWMEAERPAYLRIT